MMKSDWARRSSSIKKTSTGSIFEVQARKYFSTSSAIDRRCDDSQSVSNEAQARFPRGIRTAAHTNLAGVTGDLKGARRAQLFDLSRARYESPLRLCRD